jgi:hypothetical protein
MDPLKYINKMIDMYEGPRITAQEPRMGLKPGGIVEPGVVNYALTRSEITKRYMERHPEKKYKTTKTDFIFEGKKISIDVPGMKPESKSKMKDLLKGIEKWKQDPTTENWLKIFRKARKSAPGYKGPISYRHGWSTELRKYLQGEKTEYALTKNIFDQLDIKKTLNLSKDEVKMIKSYVDLQSPAIAERIASEKALRKSFENVIEINKHFKPNPNISLNELTKKIYKSKFIDADAAGKLRMTTSVSDDVAKYLEALKGARDIPKGLKSQWSPPTGKNHKLITDRIFSQTDFRFQEGTLRKYKYSIRDSMLKLRPNTTYNLEKKLKLTKGVLDHAVGLSATFNIAPGYTEAMQVLENAVNKAKGHGIDKPFGEALRAALEKGDFSKIDAYNELAAKWQKKNPGVDVPFIRKGGDPKKLIQHFDDFSPEAQKNILKIAGGKKGLAIETKAMPMGKLLNNWWCGKKTAAGGGRIGFSSGSGCPDSVKRRNFLMLTNDVSTGRVTGEAAEQIAKNAGKVVAKAGSKSALMSILGPAGIGLDIAFEVGSIGLDVAGGKSWNRALQDNWLTGAFISGTGQEEFHKELYAKDSKAQPYGQALDLMVEYNNAQKRIEFVKQSNYRAPGLKEQALAVAERDLRGIEAQYNALTKQGKIMEEGSNEYENYMAAKTEFEDTAKAKSYAAETSLKYQLDTPESSRFTPSDKSTGMKIDFKLPENYTTFKADLPTKEGVTEYFKEHGYDLSPQQADEVIIGEKWRQLFTDPKAAGIRGTQDWRGATGGLANLTRTVAPDSGPMQGLASTPEYDTYRKEYKWQT